MLSIDTLRSKDTEILQGLGTNLLDADDSSSISGTRKRKSAGSMKQLGRAKRQKSCSTGGDVETPPSTK